MLKEAQDFAEVKGVHIPEASRVSLLRERLESRRKYIEEQDVRLMIAVVR